MEEKCPKCGNFLITKTIKKQLGQGSIDYPVSQFCPKCNWSKDLTGAGDIVPKPPAIPAEEIKKEVQKPAVAFTPVKNKPKSVSSSSGMNMIIIGLLAAIVVGGIAWAFLQSQPKQEASVPEPTPPPAATITPVTTVVTATSGSTPAPAVTEAVATGKKIPVKLNYYRGFMPPTQKIKAGDEVVWENIEIETVTIVSNDGLFGDKTIRYGWRTNYTFKKSGTYSFSLKENKNLNGTIVVES